MFRYILTYWLFKITFITFPIHGIMIVFFKRNTFGYFRVIFTPVYCIFLLFGAFRIKLAMFLVSWKFFWFWFNSSLFPLPSALNIHKASLTGPLSVIASLIISLLPLPVIFLVQPTVKPIRRKDPRFFLWAFQGRPILSLYDVPDSAMSRTYKLWLFLDLLLLFYDFVWDTFLSTRSSLVFLKLSSVSPVFHSQTPFSLTIAINVSCRKENSSFL